MKYADVIVMRNHANLDQKFTYSIPEAYHNDVFRGSRVMVPFGSEAIEAVVFELKDTCDLPSGKVKNILFCFEHALSLTEQSLELVSFIRDNYLSTYAEALQLMVPTGALVEQIKRYTLNSVNIELQSELQLSKSIQHLLSLFEYHNSLDYDDIEVNYSEAVLKQNLKKLLALGILSEKTIYKQRVNDRYIETYKVLSDPEIALLKIPEKHVAKKRALNYLKHNPVGHLSTLKEKSQIANTVVQWLTKQSILEISKVEDRRMPTFMESKSALDEANLSENQEKVFEDILSNFDHDQSTPILMRGVTGSGKTEIYLSLIAEMLKRGKCAVFLVPEIALTPQMVSRVAKRFKGVGIALMHSKLSNGERFDQWKSMREGEIKIIIGARSAIFAPVENIGLIIIDEAHEHTYRSERRPKFDAYEVASFIATRQNALLIAGTATPTVESTFEANIGLRREVLLSERFNQKPLPVPEIIDMRAELKAGNKEILSRRLYEAIQERLQRGQQSLIFLNRTGHSTFVTCRSCGYTLECPNCDITLTYHKRENKMSCHYCQYEMFVPRNCPSCGSHYFKHFGVGTEKLEETLNKLFPDARVGRMDRTTTRKKGSFEAMIEQVESDEIDILVGTQMIAKGLDFKNVTLVGIISVDLMMNMPHFQSGELTYQMVQQVAGRAGRGDVEGEVILQTYQPDHYAINHIHYNDFYERELAFRNQMHYPPFCRMVNILFLSKEESKANDYANKAFQYLHDNLLKKGLQSKVEIYPAHPALLKKIDGFYRYQVLLKVDHEVFDVVKRWVEKLQTRFVSIEHCKINIDLNARNIL